MNNQFRSMFDNKQAQASADSAVYTDPETAKFCQQSDKEACDINNIINRFQRTGLLPPSHREQFYMDITALQDANAFQDALNQVNTAQRAFLTLPAHIRATFGNDPKAFVDAMDKKQFTKEMIDAGLVKILKAAPDASGSGESSTAADQLIQKGTPAKPGVA